MIFDGIAPAVEETILEWGEMDVAERVDRPLFRVVSMFGGKGLILCDQAIASVPILDAPLLC